MLGAAAAAVAAASSITPGIAARRLAIGFSLYLKSFAFKRSITQEIVCNVLVSTKVFHFTTTPHKHFGEKRATEKRFPNNSSFAYYFPWNWLRNELNVSVDVAMSSFSR